MCQRVQCTRRLMRKRESWYCICDLSALTHAIYRYTRIYRCHQRKVPSAGEGSEDTIYRAVLIRRYRSLRKAKTYPWLWHHSVYQPARVLDGVDKNGSRFLSSPAAYRFFKIDRRKIEQHFASVKASRGRSATDFQILLRLQPWRFLHRS